MHFSRSATSAAGLALLLGSAPLSLLAAAASAVVAVPALNGATSAAAASNATSDVVPAPAVPVLMLASDWPSGEDPAGFLVSEKLDGVRALWDGQTLRFRSGLPIAAPGWFTAALPKAALDGELWLGRGRFDELSGIVRHAEPVDADWRAVRYMVFDLPGRPVPFGQRVQQLQAVVAQAQQPWLQVVAQQQVPNAVALQALLKQTVADGGEGLVLHRASALWSPGRSTTLLKFKPVADDDARVVAHLPGKGRNAGRLGALLLELPNGQRFALGSGFSDAQRANPPPVGSLVTYRYRDRTPKGLPRFASFLRVREGE